MGCLRSFKNNSGSVAVVAVILMTFLASMVLIFAARSTARFKHVRNFEGERQALYTAESGIEFACYEARKPKDSVLTDTSLTILDGGSFKYNPFSDSLFGASEVVSEYVSGYLWVTSKGHYKTFSKTLRVKLGSRLPNAFRAGLVLTGEAPVTVEGGTVQGPIRSKAGLIPPGAFLEYEKLRDSLPKLDEKVFKDAMDSIFRASQKIDSGQSKIGELVAYNSSNPPDFRKDSLLNHVGNVLINGDRIGQVLVVEGPGIVESAQGIQVSGNIQLRNVTLVAQGDITFFDNAKLINCTVLSFKRVHIGNKSDFDGTIYCQGTVEVLDEAKVQPYTLVYCLGRGKASNQQVVTLDGKATMAGTIISDCSSGITYVGFEAAFSGILFTKASVDIRGTVNGTVIARDFQSRAGETEPFQAVFRDGKIDYYGMPPDYAAPIGLLIEPDFAIASWEVLE